MAGGLDGYNTYLDTTEVYDPRVGTWAPGARLPRPMGYMSATYIDDHILIFGKDTSFIIKDDCSVIFLGGHYYDADNNFQYDSILEYNSAGDEFHETGQMMEERGYHAISVVRYSDYSKWCR